MIAELLLATSMLTSPPLMSTDMLTSPPRISSCLPQGRFSQWATKKDLYPIWYGKINDSFLWIIWTSPEGSWMFTALNLPLDTMCIALYGGDSNFVGEEA